MTETGSGGDPADPDPTDLSHPEIDGKAPAIPPGQPSPAPRWRFLLEYVTFGFGLHHLLMVIIIQFSVLFLDVGLFEYAVNETGSQSRRILTAVRMLVAVVFLGILSAIVRKSAQRSLAPRLHEPFHQVVSVCGYVLASGTAYLFGFVTLVLPGYETFTPSISWLLSSVLFVFATFIAIGYQSQINAADHPQQYVIHDVVDNWLDAKSWVHTEPHSLKRERMRAEFAEQTAALAAVLAEAKTVEGSRLAADFRDWQQRFKVHSELSQEMVICGTVGEGRLDSERLAAEHREFLKLSDRIATIGEVTDR